MRNKTTTKPIRLSARVTEATDKILESLAEQLQLNKSSVLELLVDYAYTNSNTIILKQHLEDWQV